MMYVFHASAHGIAGMVTLPNNQEVHGKGACSLSTTGGKCTSCEPFSFSIEGLKISYDRATINIVGEKDKNGADSLTNVQVVIDNLKISQTAEIVTASRVSTVIRSRHKANDGEAEICVGESGFENLRIMSHPLVVESAGSTLDKFCSFTILQNAFRQTGTRQEVIDCMLGRQVEVREGDKLHLQAVKKGFQNQIESPNLKSTVLCSLIKNVKPVPGSNLRIHGPVIVVPNFGTVYLGEIVIMDGMRRVNMLRLELGSPVTGSVTIGSGEANGTTYPPT